MLELLILQDILNTYDNSNTYKRYLDDNYNINAIEKRYIILGEEFLNDYALNKTEKSA